MGGFANRRWPRRILVLDHRLLPPDGSTSREHTRLDGRKTGSPPMPSVIAAPEGPTGIGQVPKPRRPRRQVLPTGGGKLELVRQPFNRAKVAARDRGDTGKGRVPEGSEGIRRGVEGKPVSLGVAGQSMEVGELVGFGQDSDGMAAYAVVRLVVASGPLTIVTPRAPAPLVVKQGIHGEGHRRKPDAVQPTPHTGKANMIVIKSRARSAADLVVSSHKRIHGRPLWLVVARDMQPRRPALQTLVHTGSTISAARRRFMIHFNRLSSTARDRP